MLIFYFLFSTGLTLAYLTVMVLYVQGWRRLPGWQTPDPFVPRTRISVLIAARNESRNIGACLQSISDSAYPRHLLEIVVVDDFSEDNTAEIVLQKADTLPVEIKLLRLAASAEPADPYVTGKKRALHTALKAARGELMMTTDADCLVPVGWLCGMASLYEARQPKAIAAPVMLHRDRGLLQHFQALDFAGMMGITGAGIGLGWQRMGNGASLAYPKAVFEAVNGFAGSAGRASGDDLFLLQKIARRWPGGVLFLKDAAATVYTEACPDWRSFVQQRLRWGTKNAALPEVPVRLALAVAFLFCWSVTGSALLAFFHPCIIALLAGQLTVKAVSDYILLREMCAFFKRRDLLRWFWPCFFLHIAYLCGVGTVSLFIRKFEWKGRRVS